MKPTKPWIEMYKLYLANESEPREYKEKWEAEAIMNAVPGKSLPAAILFGNQVVGVRGVPEVTYSGNYMDRLWVIPETTKRK